jgi:hypothetical protein
MQDALLAQKLGRIQPCIDVFARDCMGRLQRLVQSKTSNTFFSLQVKQTAVAYNETVDYIARTEAADAAAEAEATVAASRVFDVEAANKVVPSPRHSHAMPSHLVPSHPIWRGGGE